MARPPVRPSKAPNLLNAPELYGKSYTDNLNNVLRLYFNEIDNFTTAMLSSTGAGFLDLPHIAASDLTDQYAGGDNTPTIVKWSVLDSGSGFTLNANNTATASVNATYKIDYSLQLANTDNAIHDVDVWLKIDGVDVPRSTSKFTLQARKSAGVPNFVVAYSSIVFDLLAGQSVGLWWATGKAYNTVGPVNGTYIEYQAAQTVPYAHPSVPSSIGSITFVSRL